MSCRRASKERDFVSLARAVATSVALFSLYLSLSGSVCMSRRMDKCTHRPAAAGAKRNLYLSMWLACGASGDATHKHWNLCYDICEI